MDELIQKLFESEVFTEETKDELIEKFDAYKQKFEEDTETRVKAELTEKFIEEKEELVEALDTKTQQFLNEHLAELREDIESYRDLEAEYASKLVEERKKMHNMVKEDTQALVEYLDSYLDLRLDAEFDELRESIDEVRKQRLGMKIMEAFAEEFNGLYRDEDDTELKLEEAYSELERTKSKLTETTKQLQNKERHEKLNEVLGNLSGRSKEVMQAILENVPTENLEDAYGRYIGRVLHEAADGDETSEKDKKVLAEDSDENTDNLKVVDGNSETSISDEEKLLEDAELSEDERRKKLFEQRLRQLSGQSK